MFRWQLIRVFFEGSYNWQRPVFKKKHLFLFKSGFDYASMAPSFVYKKQFWVSD